MSRAQLCKSPPPPQVSDLYGEAGEVNARTDDPLVVVGVHAHRVSLQVKRVLTILHLQI